MKQFVLTTVWALALAAGVVYGQSISTLPKPDDAVSFLVVGDWGRHGQFGQRETAAAMGVAASSLDIAAVISTGDNFYPDGVASTMDPAWEQSFERVYTDHHLYAPWIVALGNHDYHGNPQAQIDYSKISQRWTMPSRYFTYEVVEDVNDTDTLKILFVVIDTNPFQRAYHDAPAGSYGDVAMQDTATQMRWLDSVLVHRDPHAWCVVVGHHPMYAGGKRKGKTTDMIDAFHALFSRHGVDAYFAGHEHDLQHHDDGSTVQYFVSGAGAEVRPTGQMEYTRFARSVGGFAACTATLKDLTIRFVDHQTSVIYTTVITR